MLRAAEEGVAAMWSIERRPAPIGRIALLAALLGLCAAPLPAERVSVPPELEAWRGWALHGAEHRACPFLVGRSATDIDAYWYIPVRTGYSM